MDENMFIRSWFLNSSSRAGSQDIKVQFYTTVINSLTKSQKSHLEFKSRTCKGTWIQVSDLSFVVK